MVTREESKISDHDLGAWRKDFERVSGIIATLKETAQERRALPSWEAPLIHYDVTQELKKRIENIETHLRDRGLVIDELKRGTDRRNDDFRLAESRFLYQVAVELAALDGPLFRASGVGFQPYVSELLTTAQERILNELQTQEKPYLLVHLHANIARLMETQQVLEHDGDGRTDASRLHWKAAKEAQIEQIRIDVDQHLQTDDMITMAVLYARNAGENPQALTGLNQVLEAMRKNGRAQRELDARLRRPGIDGVRA